MRQPPVGIGAAARVWETSIGDAMSTDGNRTESGLPPNTPDGSDATADAPGTVEGDAAGQNADPDLITDDDLDGGDS